MRRARLHPGRSRYPGRQTVMIGADAVKSPSTASGRRRAARGSATSLVSSGLSCLPQASSSWFSTSSQLSMSTMLESGSAALRHVA